MWDVLEVGLDYSARDLCTKYTEPQTLKCSCRGWNLPELGWAAEMDAVRKQQLKRTQSGSKVNEEEVAE